MIKTQEEYRQILEQRLDEAGLMKRVKNAALTAGVVAGSAAIGGGLGVATPHISNAKVSAMNAIGNPLGISNVETARQGVRANVGLGANTPATTRFGVGAGIGVGLAGAAFMRSGKPKRRPE
jgi:hypothetical protein